MIISKQIIIFKIKTSTTWIKTGKFF